MIGAARVREGVATSPLHLPPFRHRQQMERAACRGARKYGHGCITKGGEPALITHHVSFSRCAAHRSIPSVPASRGCGGPVVAGRLLRGKGYNAAISKCSNTRHAVAAASPGNVFVQIDNRRRHGVDHSQGEFLNVGQVFSKSGNVGNGFNG